MSSVQCSSKYGTNKRDARVFWWFRSCHWIVLGTGLANPEVTLFFSPFSLEHHDTYIATRFSFLELYNLFTEFVLSTPSTSTLSHIFPPFPSASAFWMKRRRIGSQWKANTIIQKRCEQISFACLQMRVT